MSSYTYTSVTKNGINLYIIKTTANNIQPKNANRSWNRKRKNSRRLVRVKCLCQTIRV